MTSRYGWWVGLRAVQREERCPPCTVHKIMPRKTIPERVFRIHLRPDGRYESRNEIPTDSPLGVDSSMNQALGTAKREATIASLDACRVRIEVQVTKRKWKQVDVVYPP